MAGNVQHFDLDQAQALKDKLDKEIHNIQEALDKISKQVETISVYGHSGLELQFIQNFETTKAQAMNGLRDWVGDYNRLIEQVSEAYRPCPCCGGSSHQHKSIEA